MSTPEPWAPPPFLAPTDAAPDDFLTFNGSESPVEAALKSAHNASLAARQQRDN